MCLVALSVLDNYILAMTMSGSTIGPQNLSVLRLLRLARLVRIMKILRNSKKLNLVLSGVIEAMTSTFWVCVVVAVAIYIGSIFCVGMLGRDDGTYSEKYPGYSTDTVDIENMEFMVEYNPHLAFGNMGRAMLTLFNVVLLVEWPEVVRPLMIRQPGFVLAFVCFVLVVTFGIFNVIVAMICEHVMKNAHALVAEAEEKVLAKKLRILKQIGTMVNQIDQNVDGKVSFEEIEDVLNKKDSALLAMLNSADLHLPIGFSPHELLCMLDHDGDGMLTCDEFVQSFYRFIDGGQFQHMCLLQTSLNTLRVELSEMSKELRCLLDLRFDELDAKLLSMRKQAEVGPACAPERLNRVERATSGDLAQTYAFDANSVHAVLQAMVGEVVHVRLESLSHQPAEIGVTLVLQAGDAPTSGSATAQQPECVHSQESFELCAPGRNLKTPLTIAIRSANATTHDTDKFRKRL